MASITGSSTSTGSADTGYYFPFGEPVTRVIQPDMTPPNRTPKQVFVLGVYASAVHAHWIDPHGKTRIRAMAVASEPYIFWRGDGAEAILSRITIPPDVGQLLPAAPQFNGPSGIALDTLFLHPLGLQRDAAWLCDLVPHSCQNPQQRAAIERVYVPLLASHGLPPVTVPPVPRQLADAARRVEILAELEASGAETLILLGDQPIRWFLRAFDPRWHTLSSFGVDNDTYGRLHATTINGKPYQVLPLAHPRQAAQLGTHASAWYARHQVWISHTAPHLKR